jgi:hypothetical protein
MRPKFNPSTTDKTKQTTKKKRQITTTTNPLSWVWWLKPVILATWEAEVRRIKVQSKPRQKILKTLSQPIAEHGGAHL